MAFPAPEVAELRFRLDVAAEQWSDERLQHFLDVALAFWVPRCDVSKSPAADAAYLEGIYQAAVKVAGTAASGPVSMSPDGMYDYSLAATPGLMRSVLGVIQPALKNAGVVVG